jgi:hypothetical protein
LTHPHTVDATGKVIILGDLQVDGTTTTINSTTLEVDDKNIELSKGAANKAASDGAGISIDLGTDDAASINYSSTDDRFNINKPINVSGSSSFVDTRITNSATNIVPLIVNSIASTAARLQEWQINGVFVAGISQNGRINLNEGIANSGSTNNAYVNVGSTGTIISRNIADTNPALIVNLANASATGNIQVWQKAGSALATITNTGGATFTGNVVIENALPKLFLTDTDSNSDYSIWNNQGTFSVRDETNASMRLIINSTGNVGVGTTPTGQLQVKSGATDRVALIVDSQDSASVNTQEWKENGTNRAVIFRNGTFQTSQGIGNLTSTNNAYVQLSTTGTTISRNIADTNPALIINLANAGSTAFIQKWQKAGTDLAYVSNNGTIAATQFSNYNSGNNAVFIPSDNGSIISRNINDANVVLKVQQANASATGDLQQWIYGTNTYAYVDKDGDFYNASGSYGQISDLRVKENIVEARDYTEDLMKLRVVKYSLKKDQEQEATKLGFHCTRS